MFRDRAYRLRFGQTVQSSPALIFFSKEPPALRRPHWPRRTNRPGPFFWVAIRTNKIGKDRFPFPHNRSPRRLRSMTSQGLTVPVFPRTGAVCVPESSLATNYLDHINTGDFGNRSFRPTCRTHQLTPRAKCHEKSCPFSKARRIPAHHQEIRTNTHPETADGANWQDGT